jgi:hypothetical protein
MREIAVASIAQGLSQAGLAKLLRTSPGVVSRHFDSANPRLTTLRRYWIALGFPDDYSDYAFDEAPLSIATRANYERKMLQTLDQEGSRLKPGSGLAFEDWFKQLMLQRQDAVLRTFAATEARAELEALSSEERDLLREFGGLGSFGLRAVARKFRLEFDFLSRMVSSEPNSQTLVEIYDSLMGVPAVPHRKAVDAIRLLGYILQSCNVTLENLQEALMRHPSFYEEQNGEPLWKLPTTRS